MNCCEMPSQDLGTAEPKRAEEVLDAVLPADASETREGLQCFEEVLPGGDDRTQGRASGTRRINNPAISDPSIIIQSPAEKEPVREYRYPKV